VRIEKLRTNYQIDVKFVQFPLHPETPEEGLTLEELFAGRDIDLPSSQARMLRLMEEEGLPYGDRTMTCNSRLAQELAKWAETQPIGERVHDVLFRAYFVDGVNLAKIESLVAIAEQAGASPGEARDILSQRSFREAVDLDWQRSRELGVTSVPTFVAGRQGVAGAQPYELLEQLVVDAGATLRNDPA